MMAGISINLRSFTVPVFLRAALLRRWLNGDHLEMSPFQLFGFLVVRPLRSAYQTFRARVMIESVQERGETYEVRLQGFDHPIFIPASAGLGELIRVIVEQTNPGHHHYYEFGGACIGPMDVVLDCGASEGFFCLLVHSRCSKVYAIEPLPEFVTCLRLNLKHIQNAEILPYGLSDRTGRAALVTRGICSYISEEEDGVAITQSTIDNLFFDKGRRVDFIKADLEGFEIRMLEGARQTIAKNKPKISITTYHDPNHARQIRDFLLEIDSRYRIATKGVTQYGTPVMLHAWVGD